MKRVAQDDTTAQESLQSIASQGVFVRSLALHLKKKCQSNSHGKDFVESGYTCNGTVQNIASHLICFCDSQSTFPQYSSGKRHFFFTVAAPNQYSKIKLLQ